MREPRIEKGRVWRLYCSCIPGSERLVAALLARDLAPGCQLLTQEEGLVVVRTSAQPAALERLSYCNNVFQVLFELGRPSGIDGALRTLLDSDRWQAELRRSTTPREFGFRLVLSDENRLVPGDKRLVARLMDQIQGVSGLEARATRRNVEYWVLRRRAGTAYFCKRLTRRHKTERDLQQGELRPELTRLMCELSEPEPSDIVLDPFTGSGALALARARLPYNMIFAFDTDAKKLPALKEQVKALKKTARKKPGPFIVREEDVKQLSSFEAGFVHKVLGDPPWGWFDASIADLAGFYELMFEELVRVTRPRGVIVLLLGRTPATERLLAYEAGVSLVEQFEILVAGKKAVLAKWRRS